MKPSLLALLFLSVIATRAPLLSAQSQSPPIEQAERVRLFQARDAAIALGVAAATAAAMSVDQKFAQHLQRPSVQSNTTLKGGTNVFNNIGFPGTPIMSAGFYFLGLGRHSRPIAS